MSSGLHVRLVAAFATVYLMWGGTFLAIRYAVAEIPPLMTMVLRCAAGAALLLVWLAWRGSLERPTRAQWLTAAAAGTFLFLGCHGLLAWAERRVTSGEAALLMTAIPLWLVVLESLLLRRAPSRRVVLGLLLGVSGVAVLTAGERWSGALLDRGVLVVSALFWAVGTLIVRRGATPRSAGQSTAMQLGAGSFALLAVSLAVGEPSDWSAAELTERAWLSLAFLVLGGTVLGFGAYTWLLRVTSAAAASTYAFVNPVIALLLAWMVGDGDLSARTGLAAVLVVGAVVLSREGQERASTGPAKARASGARGRPAAPPGGWRLLGGPRAAPAGGALPPRGTRAPAGAPRGGG
ncbi:MAG TPA: EamA family transporter [Gemmatimonadales bacterium]|nr:EamA family transporter [Gemmatimonadales bacterium]